jgi:hypothetical protein
VNLLLRQPPLLIPTFSQHSVNSQGTFSAHLGNIQCRCQTSHPRWWRPWCGEFSPPATATPDPNIQSTFSQHSGNDQCTFREHSVQVSDVASTLVTPMMRWIFSPGNRHTWSQHSVNISVTNSVREWCKYKFSIVDKLLWLYTSRTWLCYKWLCSIWLYTYNVMTI